MSEQIFSYLRFVLVEGSHLAAGRHRSSLREVKKVIGPNLANVNKLAILRPEYPIVRFSVKQSLWNLLSKRPQTACLGILQAR